MIVIDASVMLELLLATPAAHHLRQRIQLDGSLHAPHLIDLEVAQVLRRYCATGVTSPERAEQALVDLSDLHLDRYPHQPFFSRIWELRHNVSAYDAAYIALAEALDAPLLTADQRLANAPGHPVTIEMIPR